MHENTLPAILERIATGIADMRQRGILSVEADECATAIADLTGIPEVPPGGPAGGPTQ